MGYDNDRVLPRLLNVMRAAGSADDLRRRVCAGLSGEVVEIGFGSASFDAALSTWTLCTIPDVDAALREVRRVLRPGGALHFVEHGLAPDERVRTWQRRLEPLQKRMVGGCHLTRRIVNTPKIFAADSLGVARRD